MNRIIQAAGLSLAAALLAGAVSAETIRLRATHGSPTGSSAQVMTYISNVVGRVDPNIQIELSGNQPGTKALLQGAKGEADLHLIVPFIASLLKNGRAMYKDIPGNEELFGKLRTMAMYPGGTFQLVVWEKSGIRSLEDLRGKNVFFGPRGAAVSRMMQDLTRAITGMEPDEDYTLVSLDFGSAFQAFQDGQIDTWFRPVPVGNPGIQQAASVDPIRLIGISEADLQNEEVQRQTNIPGRSLTEVAPDAYGPNQANEEPVTTWNDWTGVGIPVHVPDDVAYSITKAFWENLGDLQSVAAWANGIEIQNFANFTNLPVHPGAARYYEERGLEVPDIK
ncbi:MAG: TAXI family TRAP transporter solute-binding subunit [Boseongicola sp. SB0662_bin_57]|nr:TAXI family TRAP transporter solute-binding subunit [Boseongicola sp. SB0662_bin_57]